MLGNRIAKKVNGVITRFVGRSGHVLYETTGDGTLTYSYQWGLETDDLVAIHDHGSGAHYYVVQDRLRSVRGLVNRNGSWVAAWRYRAYGVGLDSAGSASVGLKRFRWAGAQYDAETGFYFLRTRSYDPSVGRFVQEDKVGRAGGANLYAYAGGDPLGRRDPGGTMFTYDLQYKEPTYNCWNAFACSWDGLDGGGGYRSASAIPDGFFMDWIVRAANSALRSMIEMDMFRATHPKGRPMTPDERAAAGNACGQLDCDRVRIREGSQSVPGFTFGYGIWIDGTLDMKMFTDRYLLVHELWHVYQFQTKGWLWYVFEGFLSAVSRLSFRSPYALPATPTSASIWDYGFEQQGDIVAECVVRSPGGPWCTVSPWQR